MACTNCLHNGVYLDFNIGGGMVGTGKNSILHKKDVKRIEYRFDHIPFSMAGAATGVHGEGGNGALLVGTPVSTVLTVFHAPFYTITLAV
jgi:hypothetical protein